MFAPPPSERAGGSVNKDMGICANENSGIWDSSAKNRRRTSWLEIKRA